MVTEHYWKINVGLFIYYHVLKCIYLLFYNLFINNTALWNVSKVAGSLTDGSEGTTKGDFIRTVSTPIDFTEASVDHLQDMLAIAPGYSNKSIVIKLDTNA